MSQERIILPPIPPLEPNTHAEVRAVNARIEAYQRQVNSAFSGNQSWRDKSSFEKRLLSLRSERNQIIERLHQEHTKLVLAREQEQKDLDKLLEENEKKWDAAVAKDISELTVSNCSSETTPKRYWEPKSEKVLPVPEGAKTLGDHFNDEEEVNPIKDLEL